MDAHNDPECEMITLMKSAQWGATEILNNVLGYHIAYDPAPILVIQPNQKPMGEAWSKDRLAPMLRDTPALTHLVSDPKSRDSENTILHKKFRHGHVTVVGANSPAGLASRPIRIVLCDEVDRYPPSAGREGDPVSLARRRMATFWNRKIWLVSTPTVKGASRIEASWLDSSQEMRHVPCPHCDHEQVLVWENVVYAEGEPESARYGCESCGAVWTDLERRAAIRLGRWVPRFPERRRHRGFHVSELYSRFVTMEDMVRGYEEAKRLPETLKTWVNTALGEPYEEEGEYSTDPDKLHERRETYDLPDEAQVITIGVDIQGDRMEAEKVAWSKTMESWSVDYQIFLGDPRVQFGESGSPWDKLQAFIETPVVRADGTSLRTHATCIDANFLSDEAYRYCRRRWQRHIYAVRGVGGMGKPAIISMSYSENRKDRSANRCRVYNLGVDAIKSRIYSRLSITEHGPGFCHFPDHYELKYFDGLTAEKAVRSIRRTGQPRIEWIQIRERNEPCDCRAYAIAALEIRAPGWARIARSLKLAKPPENTEDGTPNLAEPDTLKPAARAKKRRRTGSYATSHRL